MPKAEISIDLDNPKDYFEILEGEKFKNSKVEIAVKGNRLVVKIEADTPKALITALGGLVKQVRIIDQTSDLVKK